MKLNARKKIILAVAAAFSLAGFVPTASAADVVVGDLIKFGDGPGSPGGEFNIDVLTNGTGTDFITFCLEKNENVDFSSTFKVASVTSGAISGGVGGPNPDPISNATAWLYTKYRAGALAGYLGDATSANNLQNAIWYLEDEGVTYGSLSAQAQGWATAGLTNGTTTAGVAVMNLVTLSGAQAQDQLILDVTTTVTNVPEPETYAMLLAGLGLMGFVARRRKLKLATA